MDKSQKIDYSKFKAEVFSPDGVLIREAHYNTSHQFFCPGLTPGQNYNLVFSYDGALLMCTSFTCNESGKTVFLSPAHMLFNSALRPPKKTFISGVKTAIKKRSLMKIPLSRWEILLLENIAGAGNHFKSPCLNADGFNLYVSGSDFSTNNL
jgi:hypothetical protein